MTEPRRRLPFGSPLVRGAGAGWSEPTGRQTLVRVGGGLGAACVVLGLGLLAAPGSGEAPTGADAPAAVGRGVSGAAAAPGAGTVESVAASERVVFRVWGSDVAGVETVYAGDAGGGRTTRLPVTVSVPVAAGSGTATYRLTARLRGDGDVHCSVTAGGRTRTGHATGGERVCAVRLDVPGGRR